MSIKQQIFSGVFYTAIAKYAGIIISLIVSAILARLLTPSDFGVIAIAMVFISFLSIFSELGIGAAIIQKKELQKDNISHIYSFTVFLGLGLAILFFLSSWLIEKWYNNSQLLFICQILSINLLFAALNIVPNALLLKEQRFRFIAVRTLFVQIFLGFVSCFTAYKGFGINALLINPVLGSICIFFINYRENPQKFHLRIDTTPLKIIFSYSVFQFLFNFVNYFSRNLDKLLIGKYISISQLGFYEKSYRLMLLPLQNITHVITPVIHPVFSNVQNDLSKLSFYNRKLVHLLSLAGFPLSVFLFFASKEIILIVFGNQWNEAIPIFRIFSLSAGIQIILSSSGSIFQAANDTKGLFFVGTVNSAVMILGLFISLIVYGTVISVAIAFCITILINFIYTYGHLSKNTFHNGFFPIIKELKSAFLLSLFCTVIQLIIRYYSTADNNMLLLLSVKLILWVIPVYIYIKIFESEILKTFRLKFI